MQILWSQAVNSIYFLDDWSQRHTLNASFAPKTGHFSFPFVGGMNFNISSNTGLSTYIYPNNNELVTFMHPSVNGQDFINQLSTTNYFRQGIKVNLLSFGFSDNKAYWSFDYNIKEQLNLQLPLDLFKLIKLGFEHETNQYDLKDLSLDQSNIAEYTVGYSRDLNQKVRLGVNLKFLIGLSSEQIKYSNFDVLLSNDRYQIDARGETNIMSDVLTFGFDSNNNINFLDPDINFSSKNPAGTGGAIDLGITYKPNVKWTFSGAVNDLGLMFWNASKITKGIANSNFIFTGFTIVDVGNNNIESQLNQLEQDLNKLILFQNQGLITSNSVKWNPTSINLSAQYSIFAKQERDIKLGLLLNSYNSATYNSNQIMAAVTFKPSTWFSLATTYSVFLNESNRFGVAMNFSPEWLNAFIAADFSSLKINRQFIPIDKFNMNFQAGISLFLGE